jgi:glycogen(starch) synthase
MNTPRPVPGRVLMTADAVGGVWTYALDLAAGLADHGTATTLAILGPPPAPDQRQAAAGIPGLSLVETGLKLDWTADSPAEILAAGDAIAALASEIGADLVHLNNPALAARARFAQPLVVLCHSCVATWWAAVRGADLPADFAWRTALVAAGCRAADALVAPSRAFARATAAAYGIADPIVVHNGRRRRPASAPAGEGAALVFTAGRLWDEGKNARLLDEAAALLHTPVLAAGPIQGPNGAQVDLRHVQVLGSLPASGIAAHLAARPIFCSPARYEPFGLAVLEAAEAGCALVLADIPTFRELWDGAALFVSPDDAPALAARLRNLLEDAAERARLGLAARDRAGRYTAHAMVAGTLEVYRSVIQPRPVSWPGSSRPSRSPSRSASGRTLATEIPADASSSDRDGPVEPGHDKGGMGHIQPEFEQPSMHHGLQGVSR